MPKENGKTDNTTNVASALPPALQEQLQKYSSALEEEWKNAETTKAAEGEDFEKLVRDTFKEHTPLACATIVYLCGNGESEATRIKAAKMILDEAFKIAQAEADPLKKLINELTASNDERTETADTPSSK